jgi:hypothetical protein
MRPKAEALGYLEAKDQDKSELSDVYFQSMTKCCHGWGYSRDLGQGKTQVSKARPGAPGGG